MNNWFVGIPVPAGPWLAEVLGSAPAALRRFHPDDLHVTVAFLGECGEANARAAFDHVGAPFRGAVRLGACRPMGNPDKPSAFSMTLSDDGGLSAWIAERRNVMTDAAGARRDRYDVFPHVTVCRPGLKADPAILAAGIAWAATVPTSGVALELSSVNLYTRAVDDSSRLFRVLLSQS